MFTGPVGPVEVFFYWPEAVLGNFYWPGAIGPLLASSPAPLSSRPVHMETISIPRGIFQSNWQHIAHKL